MTRRRCGLHDRRGGDEGITCGIYDIMVDPQFRRRGIVSNMIRRALSTPAGPLSELLLEVDDGNAPAALYRQLGFLFRYGRASYE